MRDRMRNLTLNLLLAGLFLACSGSGFSQVTDGVQIVNGKDGVGMSQSIPVGNFQVDGKQLGANVSVKVGKGYFVQFCPQKDGSGKCEGFGEGTHNLVSTDFSFIRVGTGELPSTTASASAQVGAPANNPTAATPARSTGVAPLTVYEQKNWGGRAQILAPGMYRSFRGEFGKINDNQARSVIIAKGFRARFCSEEGMNFRGAGDCESHEEGRHNLRFANTISFIEVTDLSDTSPADEKMPVVLYEDALQGGKMQGFDEGTYLASGGQFKKLGNDQAQSIRVKDGYRASVCSDEPASGGEPAGCEEYGPGRKDFKSRKTASYLRVWKDSK
jgi:hypothetical protein